MSRLSVFKGNRRSVSSMNQEEVKSNAAFKHFLETSPEPRVNVPGLANRKRMAPIIEESKGHQVTVNPITGNT